MEWTLEKKRRVYLLTGKKKAFMPYIGKSSCESEAAVLGVRTKEHTGCMEKLVDPLIHFVRLGWLGNLLSLSFCHLESSTGPPL